VAGFPWVGMVGRDAWLLYPYLQPIGYLARNSSHCFINEAVKMSTYFTSPFPSCLFKPLFDRCGHSPLNAILAARCALKRESVLLLYKAWSESTLRCLSSWSVVSIPINHLISPPTHILIVFAIGWQQLGGMSLLYASQTLSATARTRIMPRGPHGPSFSLSMH
jgi:hypothetical protein